MSTLLHFFEQYALFSLEKQEKLARLIGEHAWELDLDAGTVRFDHREFPVQVLGTESDNTLSWLWAWANEQAEIPEHLLKAARELREWGRREGVEEFTLPSVDLSRVDGHQLALIAAAVARASAYYRGPYEGGAVFFLLFGREIDSLPAGGLTSLSQQFMNIISLYDFHHRNAFLSYLRMENLTFVEKGPTVTAQLATGEDVRAEFDKLGRLLSINGQATTG